MINAKEKFDQKRSVKYSCPGTGFALMILALTLVPVGIKNAAEVVCIGQTSYKIWKSEKNHADANMLAVQRCNGKN